jgi:hypothetical protein
VVHLHKKLAHGWMTAGEIEDEWVLGWVCFSCGFVQTTETWEDR